MDTNSNQVRVQPETTAHSGLAARIGLFVVLLACALAVVMLGANYYALFPTNGSLSYAVTLGLFFLAAALLFKRSEKLARYWPIAYAFFIASTINVISDLFASYNSRFMGFFGIIPDTNPGLGMEKVYSAALLVIPVIGLTWLAGDNLGSLYLKIGNLNRKWGWGIGSLLLVNYLTSVLIFFGEGYKAAQLGPVILWGLVFSLSNSLLEEVWVRGLFLKKLTPLIGAAGAVLLTSILFAALHFLSVAYLPASVVPIFVVNTFTMGLACGILMVKTDSIWGAFLIHAAADLFLFIAILAVH